MQFVMHYAFESEEKARTMLLNVSKNLRRGGYFIGTIPSSDALIEGIKSLGEDEKEFGNSVYKVRFPERPTQTVFRPPYGHRYNFFMEDAVENVPEYIVPFEVFRGYSTLKSKSNFKSRRGCEPRNGVSEVFPRNIRG